MSYSFNMLSALTAVNISLLVVGGLIGLLGIVSACISIYLSISYIKYNRTSNSIGRTGKEIAREILDNNGLSHIKVSKNGSLLFGNSYSHYFKKVRLRRLTWKKASVSSLAMATQKSCLAILDKENDKDMVTRIKLTPFINLGPLAFIPLILIGLIIDVVVLKSTNFTVTAIFTGLGFIFYILAVIMAIKVLKTEVKAQERAYVVMKEGNLATDREIEMCKKLFHLYNIEYVNNIIIAFLELIYRILQVIAKLLIKENNAK